MPEDYDDEHGTLDFYEIYGCRCSRCIQAYENSLEPPEPDQLWVGKLIPHGKTHSYVHYRCRCELCVEAMKEYRRDYRQRLSEETKAYRRYAANARYYGWLPGRGDPEQWWLQHRAVRPTRPLGPVFKPEPVYILPPLKLPPPARRGRPPKLSPEQQLELTTRYLTGEHIKDLAREYGISASSVDNIVNRCLAD